MAILRDLLVNSTARILGSLYAKNVTADVFKGNLMGKFSTARKIGNAPFDGSADISLSQIGAAAVSHSHSYLPLSGGTLSGVLTLKSGVYTDDYIGALNANNSNIYGINSLIFADLSDSSAEGIQFYRTNTTVDSFWAKNGILYFTPNRTLGSNAADYTIIHTGNINSHAAPVSHTHSYLPLTGGTVSGPINSSKVTSTYLAGNQGQSIINSTVSAGSYVMLAKMNSTNGYFTHGAYQDKYLLQYTAKSTVDAGTNNVTKSVTLLNEAGNTSFPGTVSAASFSGNATSSSTSAKLATARKIGNASFNGTADITLAQIGAAPSTATRYLTVTIPSSGWSASAPYTQTVTVSGVTSSDNPVITGYIPTGTSATTAKAMKKAAACLDSGVTNSGTITLYCFNKKPASDFQIQIKGI